MNRILELSHVTRRFGGVTAVSDVDLVVERGSVHAVVGPNGAGKTTLFNVVSGFVLPDEGSIRLDGEDITMLAPHRRVPLGVVRTFQNIRLFSGMSVRDNVLVGQHTHANARTWSILRPRPTANELRLRHAADEVIALLGLSEYADRPASGLPYGIRKRVELARALAARPKLLLLDEPTAGMNDDESADIIGRIAELRQRGMTVLLVEHDMKVVMRASDRVTVLDFGRVIADGTPGEIQKDPAVRTAYLGA